ncbi:MAG TPA: type III pantothenate kinase [Candidatus Pelagibacter sp.]|jgi:type III pantothenate kinase|nr:type III pantothenate kinase [Candidatus Pelagibacter sp.]|tara:strand:+ start:12434 stop:13186 length:753 start_codon:yes stop_codon:yes gene_type:complete
MYLIGDIGNTEVKICAFNRNKKLLKKIILKSNLITNKYLYKHLIFLKSKKYKLHHAIFCSVVPKYYNKIKFFIKKKLNINCTELKELKLDKLIKIKVNRKQIGSDRLSNAISVIDNKNNYVIVDFGTATTFDVVVKNNYLGGIIAPGVNLSLNTLISKASLIPSLALTSVNNILGKNTKSAVKSGFYWGYAGLIDNIIKKIIDQTNNKYKIIFTGGLSHLFKKTIDVKVKIDRDLTIKGLLKVIHLLKQK